jgi:uroporphyrinogen decarboxylase
VTEEDERTVTIRNVNGVLVRTLKNSSNMPQYLAWPVRDRKEFEKIKKRYDPTSSRRYPENWAEIARESLQSECPAWGPAIGSVGFFSMIRTWMGTENACTVFYDDPALAHDMCEYIADFTIKGMQRALFQAKLDYFMWWEDFSFKTGPLISPSIFKEFLLVRYRRVNDVLRKAGIDIIFLDTDGDPRLMYKLLLDAGVNGAYPLEQCCQEMSPVALRKAFGRDLLLWGGIDKRELAKDHAAIDRELEAKLPPLLADGGYIPQLDHLAPPDISYKNWLYFLERKKRLLEKAI